MDEEPLMDLHPEVQQCLRGQCGHSSEPTGISDPTQTAAVAADDGGERKTRVERKTDRKDAELKLIVDIRRQDQRWATV